MTEASDPPSPAAMSAMGQYGSSDLAVSPFSLPAAVRGKEVRVAWVGRTSTEDHQDPRQSLLRQLERTKAALPESWVISAHYYDVESGRLDMRERGKKSGYERFGIPIARDGGLTDLRAEAKGERRCFDVVMCEAMSRVARKMYETLSVERQLDEAGVAVFAANEPIALGGARAQQILQRRINQSVAEYEVLNMLEQSWGGTCTHVREGYNIGKPCYGYAAKVYRHPNPVKAEKGLTKTRLEPDEASARTVTLIAKWRYHERLGFDTIADRLNADLREHPPPVPPGGRRARGAWSKTSVADVLKNPKYTGFQVYNRRARRSRGGRGVVNPPEMWVWTTEPVHEPLIPKWMFDALNARSQQRRGSRDGAGKKKDRRATRTYLLRRRVMCDCGRSMTGNVRHDCVYYRCHPLNNNRGRADKHANHPKTVYMREDLILDAVNRFFDRRVFGRDRVRWLLDAVDTGAQEERTKRQQRRETIHQELSDVSRKQDNVLAQAETHEPNDPFVRGLKDRYNRLDTERDALVAELDQLEAAEQNADIPSAAETELLDALPHLAVNLHRAPRELLNRLFDLVQLTIQVHYESDEATIRVQLPGEHLDAISMAGHAVATTNTQTAGESCEHDLPAALCASCMCPRCDSNAHWTDFECVTGACSALR